VERSEAALQRLSSVGRRYHYRNRLHHLILGIEPLQPRPRHSVPRSYNPNRKVAGHG
jgi:hypothetical protein